MIEKQIESTLSTSIQINFPAILIRRASPSRVVTASSFPTFFGARDLMNHLPGNATESDDPS